MMAALAGQVAVEAKIAAETGEGHLAGHRILGRANTLALQAHYHLHLEEVKAPKSLNFLQVDKEANRLGMLSQGVVPIVGYGN